MIRFTAEVKTLKDDIGDLSKRAQAKVKDIIFADSHETLADAQGRSRVDTGEMRAGWRAPMVTPYQYELSNPVEHTIYNEFGTSRMSAQPMATPAIEAAAQRLPRRLGEAFKP